MASIQPKNVKGYKYWQIVSSQRVNGKPRPIVLEHLGTADSLLKRLKNRNKISVKSYSHGLIAAILKISQTLNIVSIINKHVKSQRKYFTDTLKRHDLTVGAYILFIALGRICEPTSKMGWLKWATKTSLSFLLKINISKIESQDFWDTMDCIPEDKIDDIGFDILEEIKSKYNIKTDTLFYDTTNFFTYIATTNKKCTIAQRGKNKQKRTDLRQFGLAMTVSKEDYIPIFHDVYEGNKNDSPVFKENINKLESRLTRLKMKKENHTIVFDRGCNSKKNLKYVEDDKKLFYVGALSPCYHESLIEDANENYETIKVNNSNLSIYRDKREIWGKERTVIVFVSEKLKAGQVREIYKIINKIKKQLDELQASLDNPRGKKYVRKELIEKIDGIIYNKKIEDSFSYTLTKKRNQPYKIEYKVDENEIENIKEDFGFRIIMTNRHNWNSHDIIKAYYGQSVVEHAFKNLKNPFHLSLRPNFHWTDQKIRVHAFACVLGYTLTMLLWKTVKEKCKYKGNLDNLLDDLNEVRLATILERDKNKPNVKYQLEELDEKELGFMKALECLNIHERKLKLKGISVYK
jgi:transposase